MCHYVGLVIYVTRVTTGSQKMQIGTLSVCHLLGTVLGAGSQLGTLSSSLDPRCVCSAALPPSQTKKKAEEMFKLLGEALLVLEDSMRRQLYDAGYDKEAIEERIQVLCSSILEIKCCLSPRL